MKINDLLYASMTAMASLHVIHRTTYRHHTLYNDEAGLFPWIPSKCGIF